MKEAYRNLPHKGLLVFALLKSTRTLGEYRAVPPGVKNSPCCLASHRALDSHPYSKDLHMGPSPDGSPGFELRL